MKPKLKLNDITNLHDARYCSAVGIYLLGFDVKTLGAPAVMTMIEWLSGPEGVGEFEYETPDEIRELTTAAQLKYVRVPLDYSREDAAKIGLPLIFSAGNAVLSETGLGEVAELAAAFPEALFEFAIAESDTEGWAFLQEKGLIERSLLCFEDPDAVYQMLERAGHKPFAFTLGAFFEEPDGALDYQKCDDFVEQFHELLPA
ncbi:MAG: hypothetical protein AAF570_10440 [Bacteroidota bacterium]